MEHTIMIEPCCCERQVPAAVDANNGRVIVFSNGDVTVNNWFKAVSYMAGPNHKLTMVVKEIDQVLARWLKNWLQRGWTTEARITTQKDSAEVVKEELGSLSERVSLAVDKTVGDELIAFEGERGCTMVCGRMLAAPQPGLSVYAIYRGKERGMVKQLMEAVESRHRLATKGASTGEIPNKKPQRKPSKTKKSIATTDDAD